MKSSDFEVKCVCKTWSMYIDLYTKLKIKKNKETFVVYRNICNKQKSSYRYNLSLALTGCDIMVPTSRCVVWG